MTNTWNQVGTLKGPKGDKGATGDAGPKGGSVRVASISVPAGGDVAFSALSPSDGVQVGDLVLDAKGSVYPISAVDAGRSTARVGSAINGVSLKGPKGEMGAVGPKGAPGGGGGPPPPGAPPPRPLPSRARWAARPPCRPVPPSATRTSRATRATCGSRPR